MLVPVALLAYSTASPPLLVSDLETSFEVRVAPGRSGCTVAFGARRFDQQGYRDELVRHARARGATRAVIASSTSTPGRCVDAIVSTLREAGVTSAVNTPDLR